VSLWVRLILVVLLVLVQYQLWLGHDGLLHRQQLNARLHETIQNNEALAARNAAAAAEIEELRRGGEALEAVARGALNYLRPDEVLLTLPSAQTNAPSP
jgi:cell division protein FtsB